MTPPTFTRNGTKLFSHLSHINTLRPMARPERTRKKSAQFASALVHEVRNPLTNINLSIEILKTLIKDDDMRVYLDIILRGSHRINDLVNDILNNQQIHDVPVEKYSIHQLLDEVVEMAQDRIRLKKIAVWKHYVQEDYKIVLNKSKVKIAFTNFIVNAIDAMDIGKGELTITTRLYEGKYIVRIADNGCGISEENLKNIFKPFFTNKPGGLGLGLATTCEILKANHIEVNVESEEGRGTCFTLSFDKNYHRAETKLCCIEHIAPAIY